MSELSTARMLMSGIPRHYHNLNMNRFPGDPVALNQVGAYLSLLSYNLDEGKGLVLFGPNGTGKTSLAFSAAKLALESGLRAHCFAWTALLNAQAASWKDSESQADFNYCVLLPDLLVIDDLGKEFKPDNDLPVTTLTRVLQRRTSSKRATIITTNATPAGLGKTYGTSIASLLNGFFTPIEFGGHDLRIQE